MIGTYPVITIGTLTGLLLAAWDVLVKQGLLEGLRPEAADALTAFVALFVPIIAALIASRFVTPVSSPNLEPGTQVNTRSALPTSTVIPNE